MHYNIKGKDEFEKLSPQNFLFFLMDFIYVLKNILIKKK